MHKLLKTVILTAVTLPTLTSLFACSTDQDQGQAQTPALPAQINQPIVTQSPPESLPLRPVPISPSVLLPTPTPTPTEKPSSKKTQETTIQPGNQSKGQPTTELKDSTPPSPIQVPTLPKFQDATLLQDIYDLRDLSIYEPNPDHGVPLTRQPSNQNPENQKHPLTLSAIGGNLPNLFPFHETKNHPYLHLFPNLAAAMLPNKTTQNGITSRTGPEGLEENPQSEFVHRGLLHNQPDGTTNYQPNFGIEHFIYHPYFEPISIDTLARQNLPYLSEGTIGIQYFGKNSTRGVIAEAVASLLEEAKHPDAAPLEVPLRRNPSQAFTTTTSLEHFIKTTIYYMTRKSQSRNPLTRGPNYFTPNVTWSLLDPELPIVRVNVYSRTILPISINPAEPPPATYYGVTFVVAFQNRWDSFNDPNRWLIRFHDHMKEEVRTRDRQYHVCTYSGCHFDERNLGLDPEADAKFPYYWHPTDYMQHSLIGPIILEVYESRDLIPGIYSTKPKVSFWEAPGPIVPSELLLAPAPTDWNPPGPGYEPKLQLYPLPNSPNPGYPLPGHILAAPHTAPGTPIWDKYQLGDPW